jgi:hypothetical protein
MLTVGGEALTANCMIFLLLGGRIADQIVVAGGDVHAQTGGLLGVHTVQPLRARAGILGNVYRWGQAEARDTAAHRQR